MSEEIFIKEKSEQPQEKVKKKRQLTQKQLDGLAKGRAKMAEKRAMKKAMEDAKARLKRQKEDTKVSEQTNKQHKETQTTTGLRPPTMSFSSSSRGQSARPASGPRSPRLVQKRK